MSLYNNLDGVLKDDFSIGSTNKIHLRPSAQSRVDINMGELATFESVWAEMATKLMSSDPTFNSGDLIVLNKPQ
jgi:hypothetical protein